MNYVVCFVLLYQSLSRLTANMPRDIVLFDINETVLNLNPLKSKFRVAFEDESAMEIWFSMLLHSSTVCALTETKTNFARLASTMLDVFATRHDVERSDTVCAEILNGFASLPPHEDIKPALTRLQSAGYRTVAFSNSSVNLITRQIENGDLVNYFDDVISVEETGSFKPDPKVYEFVSDRINRTISDLRLVSTHDWDTHGALSAGMCAAYIDRTGKLYHPNYRLPDVYATTMDDVVEQILIRDREN